MSTSTSLYDRFGRLIGSPIDCAPEAYIIDQSVPNFTYVCYYETGSDPRAIRRIEKDTTTGQTRVSVTWAAWSDRTSASYYGVNSIFKVNDETKALVEVLPYNTPLT